MAEKPSSKRKRTSAARKPERSTSAADFPDRIFAIASPQSTGVSLFTPGVLPDATTVGNFVSEPGQVERAVNLLADAGFEVLQANDMMINIAGSRELYESAFGTALVAEERPTRKSGQIEDTATYFDTTDTDVSGLCATGGTRFEEVLEGVAIEEPAYPAAVNAFPPAVDYFKLDVPADISLATNADKAHRAGVTGRGVVVAMVDTGWQTHPFFTDRGYRVDPTVLGPGTANAGVDENGHGTGESANIFATAPDVTLKPVKAATAAGALVNLTAAFNAAVALGPHIVSNSWTSDVRFGPLSAALQARAAAVAAAWASGVIVVFAAGNGHWGFPGQHPDVISVGGVDIRIDGSLRASNYASGFMSNVYAGPARAGHERHRRHAPEGDEHHAAAAGRLRDRHRQRRRQPSQHRRRDHQQRRLGRLLRHLGRLPAGRRRLRADQAGVHEAHAGAGSRHPDVDGARRDHRNLQPEHRGQRRHGGARPRHRQRPGRRPQGRAAGQGALPEVPAAAVHPGDPVPAVRTGAAGDPAAAVHARDPAATRRARAAVPAAAAAIPLQPAFPLQPFQPALPVQPFAPLRPFAPFGPDPGPFTAGGQGLSDEDLEALERLIIDEGGLPDS